MNHRKSLCSLFLVLSALALNATNPYLPLWEYIPDGEPYLFEDPDKPGEYRVYIYGSHDSMITEYCGREQVVWSASVDDLNDWRYDGVIFESKNGADGSMLNAGGVGDILYAPDVTVTVDKKGVKTYWLYPNNQSGPRQTMIAKSDRPDGPFVPCNWSKNNPKATEGILRFDPAVFVDDDGRVYGYWGFEKSFAAELDPKTMATLKPGTQIVEDMIPSYKQDDVFRFFEASSMRKIGDKYVFIYSRYTRDGEFGLPTTNYTLAYAYSNHPLGPYTYGGTIIDGRGRGRAEDGSVIATATPYGNTHGSILEINGRWWVFYHRQTGNDEFSRQAMVAPIDVRVDKDKVYISEAEYTSEGFETQGLELFKSYPAGIACYYTNPVAAIHNYPIMNYSGSYPFANRVCDNTIDESRSTPIVNNTNGSIVGYKYFNFDTAENMDKLQFTLELQPRGIDGTIIIMAGSPYESQGAKVLGNITIRSSDPCVIQEKHTVLRGINQIKGKQGLYFVFKSEVSGSSICDLYSLTFRK